VRTENIHHGKPVTVRRSDEITQAARAMRQHHVGYLVVTEPDPADGSERPVGVLTDRDIVVTVLAGEADPRTLRVGDVMTQNPVVVPESDSPEKALEAMRRIGVRRVPVVDARGRLVGVLSLDDILDVLAEDLQQLSSAVRKERRVETALRPLAAE
jgi:CBS domain-containing protein